MNKDGSASSQFVVQSGSDFYSASIDHTTGAVTLNKADVTYTDTDNGLTTPATQANQLIKVANDKNGNAAGYVTFQGKNYATSATSLNDDNSVTGSTNAVTVELSTASPTAQFAGAASADPLAMLDKAISTVDKFRSSLGAVQNRLDSAITNLNNTTTNLSEAQSRIQDADYATEVSNMSKAQIIQQAGNSVLAKANQVPQQVLSLLQG